MNDEHEFEHDLAILLTSSALRHSFKMFASLHFRICVHKVMMLINCFNSSTDNSGKE